VKKLLLISLVLVMTMLGAQLSLAAKQPHKEYAEAKIAECTACHKAEGIAQNHDADWLRGHRLLAGKAGNNCAQCHDQSYCLDCHTGGGINANLEREANGKNYVPRSHRNDFIMRHPLKAVDNPQQCYRCHAQQTCTECHDRYPRGNMKIKSHLPNGGGNNSVWNSEHPIEARRNLQSCQTCHPDGDVCISCHSAKNGGGRNPHPKNFKGGNLQQKGNRTCQKCHNL
jgi:cytochrome c553